MGHFTGEWLWSTIGVVAIIFTVLGIINIFRPQSWLSLPNIRGWKYRVTPIQRQRLSQILMLFIVFLVLWLAGWHVFSTQQSKIDSLASELAQQKPAFKLGESTASQTIDESNMRLIIQANIEFINVGQETAYQVQVRRCYSPAEAPQNIEKQKLLTDPNPIDVEEKFVVPIVASYPISIVGNETSISSSAMLIYCGIHFSDAPTGGNWFTYERWFTYPVNAGRIAYATQEQSEAFALYVRQAYGNETWN